MNNFNNENLTNCKYYYEHSYLTSNRLYLRHEINHCLSFIHSLEYENCTLDFTVRFYLEIEEINLEISIVPLKENGIAMLIIIAKQLENKIIVN